MAGDPHFSRNHSAPIDSRMSSVGAIPILALMLLWLLLSVIALSVYFYRKRLTKRTCSENAFHAELPA
jgi:hypothetical protein